MEIGNIKTEKRLCENNRIKILDIIVDVLDVSQTISIVEKYIIKKESLHLMGVNADKINECKANRKLKEIVNSCGVINADGASVVLASRFLKTPLPERVAGIDLMQSLVGLSAKKGYSIFLLGARRQVVEETAVVLKRQYEGLNIVGVQDGYFGEEEWPDICTLLKKKKPDLVFVGITSPLKEYLIEYFQNKGINSVFMGVGGSFDVISGKIPRAPQWIQKINMEWLFRVIQEPRRLFKRYFVGNWVFVREVIKQKRSSR